ncbi:MAG TPA: HAD-IIB family hydrolase [Actinomycetota bacterium]|nr:HAD-IIB family hydrolase [Actinomycetota bacterium]
MRYLGLATDYDGTLAHHGRVLDSTLRAMERARASGRRLILVTGRELEDLFNVFPQVELFDRVVAENGALIYRPGSREEKALAEPPPQEFIEALKKRKVEPFSVGRVIVATWEPHETAVMEAIHELGLELHIVFNKGAVMVLPSGMSKAAGLQEALHEMKLSPHNVVGVGDAENDHAFLSICECSVAVANALPTLKERSDLVTEKGHGEGVEQLIDMLVKNDLRDLEPRLTRHDIPIGTDEDDKPVTIGQYHVNVLVAGPSGSGKSTLNTALLERLTERRYQFCLIDPEGDYGTFEGALVLGATDRPPDVDELIHLLESSHDNVVVNLVGLRLVDRPEFFAALLPRLEELRARIGRPHWVIVDEAHHLLPSTSDPASPAMPHHLHSMVFITIHPDHVARSVMAGVTDVAIVGKAPDQTLRAFTGVVGENPPALPTDSLDPGFGFLWRRTGDGEVVRFRVTPPAAELQRHRRKYAQGELGDRSFYFRGPEGKLKLRAQNLELFVQMAEGVDDDTWLHHLRQHDYSKWLREAIKDEELANEAAKIEEQDLSSDESRARIREVIEQRYTLPA